MSGPGLKHGGLLSWQILGREDVAPHLPGPRFAHLGGISVTISIKRRLCNCEKWLPEREGVE